MSALNRFIDDLYNDQEVVRDGVFPAELLESSASFRPECRGVRPAYGVWAHICGSDLVRDADGTLYVLEDNLRVPSGVSYVLENRLISKRAFADLFERQSILPVDAYTDELYKLLTSLAPDGPRHPSVVVLTPGVFNSAYFEHSFLAQRMGVPLVEGPDLVVGKDDRVYMRTIAGLQPVDVIYRRVDDVFLDPEAFRPDSVLGVPGLMRAWRAGTVAIANAPGAGVADDKVVYAWVPDLIRYYLGEEPLLASVPTYRCLYEEERAVRARPPRRDGGEAGQRERRVRAAHRALAPPPGSWRRGRRRSRPTPATGSPSPSSTSRPRPTICDDGIEARHVDLRPFILSGRSSYVTAGGLTRVALRKGSLVVNSSQGGGSKDTWIVEADPLRAEPPGPHEPS